MIVVDDDISGLEGVDSELITFRLPLLSLTKTGESTDKQYTNTGMDHRLVGGGR